MVPGHGFVTVCYSNTLYLLVQGGSKEGIKEKGIHKYAPYYI